MYCENRENEKKNECLNKIKIAFSKGGSKSIAVYDLDFLLKSFAGKEVSSEWIASNWYAVAIDYLRSGKKDEAIDALNLAFNSKMRFEIQNFSFPFISVNPTFDEIREDQRFKALLKKMNL